MKVSQPLYFLTLILIPATTRTIKASVRSIEPAADDTLRQAPTRGTALRTTSSRDEYDTLRQAPTRGTALRTTSSRDEYDTLRQAPTRGTALRTTSSRDEYEGKLLARNTRSSRNDTSAGAATPAPKKGWSKGADVIPYRMRSSVLGVSLMTWFLGSYFDYTVDVDGNVEFSCKNKVTKDFAQRDPRLRWRWVKDGDPVHLDNSRMLLTDFVLYIEEVRDSDSGTYECRMLLGDGSELTADVFTLTVRTSFPTLVVRETLPLELDCNCEALADFLHNFDLYFDFDQNERRKRAGETDERRKRVGETDERRKRVGETDADSNSSKVTAEPRFEKFLRLGKAGFASHNEGGIGKLPRAASEVRVRKQTGKNSSESVWTQSILRTWYFNGTVTSFFPKGIPVDQPSPDVVEETVPRMAGEWTCKVHHPVTDHTWRTARYLLQVAPPPALGERLWRGAVAHPWLAASSVVPVVLAMVAFLVVVARTIQKRNAALEEEFEVMKTKLLVLPKGGSSPATKDQTAQSNIANPRGANEIPGTPQDTAAPVNVSDSLTKKSKLDNHHHNYHVRYSDEVKEGGVGGGTGGGGGGGKDGGVTEKEEEEEDEDNDETRRLITE